MGNIFGGVDNSNVTNANNLPAYSLGETTLTLDEFISKTDKLKKNSASQNGGEHNQRYNKYDVFDMVKEIEVEKEKSGGMVGGKGTGFSDTDDFGKEHVYGHIKDLMAQTGGCNCTAQTGGKKKDKEKKRKHRKFYEDDIEESSSVSSSSSSTTSSIDENGNFDSSSLSSSTTSSSSSGGVGSLTNLEVGGEYTTNGVTEYSEGGKYKKEQGLSIFPFASDETDGSRHKNYRRRG